VNEKSIKKREINEQEEEDILAYKHEKKWNKTEV
jgi:hypothetical protein